MSAREAAVARVLVRAYGRDFDTDDIAKRAVKAVDRAEANPSPEDVERAARAVHNLGSTAGPWEERDEEVRELYREDVRAVIAALREPR